MYTTSHIKCYSYNQALIARTILEGAGFPAVAASVTPPLSDGGPTFHCVFTAAPDVVGGMVKLISLLYDTGPRAPNGLERAKLVSSTSPQDPRGVPVAVRAAVRDQLQLKLYSVADEMGAIVNISEPAGNPAPTPVIENHDPGDEHNPAGGGWDGWCKEAAVDQYDGWKSNNVKGGSDGVRW